MAHKNTILASINLDGDTVCVDLFQRPDGSFGFDEFRRDTEDGRGWFSIGHHGHLKFETLNDAETAANAHIGWFNGRATTP